MNKPALKPPTAEQIEQTFVLLIDKLSREIPEKVEIFFLAFLQQLKAAKVLAFDLKRPETIENFLFMSINFISQLQEYIDKLHKENDLDYGNPEVRIKAMQESLTAMLNTVKRAEQARSEQKN